MSALFRAVVGAAGFKILVGLISYVAGWASGTLGQAFLPLWVYVVLILTYAAVGGVLIAWGQRDLRSVELGIFLLLIATPFSDVLARVGHPLGGISKASATTLCAEALMPAFLWLFVRDFPARAPFGWMLTVPTRLARLSVAVGVALWGVNLLLETGLPDVQGGALGWLAALDRQGGALYWPILAALMIPAAPLLIARGQRVSVGERRRVMFFVVSVAVGLVPISVDILLQMIGGAVGDALWRRTASSTSVVLIFVGVLAVPFTTAYSVLVARVIDLRLIVRAAMQYALARVSLLVLAALPVVWIAWVVYRNRFLTVQELLLGRAAILMLLASATAIAAMRARRELLAKLDRRFFREHYDAQQLLTGLAEASRRADSTRDLAELLGSKIDSALHLERIAVLVRDDATDQFIAVDGAVRPLPCDSLLAVLLGASDDPLDLEPDNRRSALRRLSERDVEWISDAGCRLLVPLRSSEAGLIGILALGEKKSELPFSPRERELLAAVGTSGGLYLESRRVLGTGRRTVPADAPARAAGSADSPAFECPACGLLYPGPGTICACGASTVEAAVPKVLAGKFQLERRIGAGGMAIVYRATDLTLGRIVAIKTLPRLDSSQTWRLRREARAMALITHENLALIFGAESWHGRPMLVEEFLAGGTLADRLKRGPLPCSEAIGLGLLLTLVLAALHDAGLLHRDLKPSNVGFSSNGTPKLLDFGLAQLLASAVVPVPAEVLASAGTTTTDVAGGAWIATDHGIGTPSYMSPEALAREPPSPSFDLWSLAVLLFEAIAGVNPFQGNTLLETISRVDRLSGIELRQHIPDCPVDLSLFFAQALSRDRRQRPSSAREFRRRLEPLLIGSAHV